MLNRYANSRPNSGAGITPYTDFPVLINSLTTTIKFSIPKLLSSVITKSGFAIRCGFKASATTLNVSLEGRFIGAGFQTGAVDAKVYTKEMKDNHNYTLRSSEVLKTNYDTAKKELREMFTKYKRLSNTIENYNAAVKLFDKGNKLTKDRFANLMSYMYSFLIAPKKFEEHMKFCYFTSKKITTDSSIYLIIQ